MPSSTRTEDPYGRLRIPAPPHRHAAPCAPWPWMNIDSDPEPPSSDPGATHAQRIKNDCTHSDTTCQCWKGYPESRFPNWRPAQVTRSRMMEVVSLSRECTIYSVDVDRKGKFTTMPERTIPNEEEEEFWKVIQEKDIRVRVLFLENLTKPVLQMLGTKFNIEPFFFTSSINWIPTRFEAELQQGKEDHMTIALTFVRAIKLPPGIPVNESHLTKYGRKIDTQAPLHLKFKDKSEYVLILDLLSVHMVRNAESSTIISYHPMDDVRLGQPHTSAKRLHSRIDLAGQSVYWSNIFKACDDPTFVLLTIIWHAIYSWDEAFELMWEYIMEREVTVMGKSDLEFARELHELRARLLHCSSLLRDLENSVEFILKTQNPAMNSERYSEKDRKHSNDEIQKECKNLQAEINRLTQSRNNQDKRLKNIMNLVFSQLNIDDSKNMQSMTSATVRDSAAMRQIAFLTMVFLPAGFCASLFGMNVKELNNSAFVTLVQFVESAVPLTAVTIWVIMAFQSTWFKDDKNDTVTVPIWTRLMWPLTLPLYAFRRMTGSKDEKTQEGRDRMTFFDSLTTPLRAVPLVGSIARVGQASRERDETISGDIPLENVTVDRSEHSFRASNTTSA